MAATNITAQAIEISAGTAAHTRSALRLLVPLTGETGGRPIELRKAQPMTGGAVGELHIAMTGEWKGHHSGPFAITEQAIDTIVARFNAQANAMMVDYDHKSLNSSGTPDDGRAAGWIHALEKRATADGFELWAVVEWTPKATEMIRAGEFRFCSPVIKYGARDRVSGEDVSVELFNVAVTNNPFLDGQQPIKLSRVAAAISAEQAQPPSEPSAPPSTPEPRAPPQQQVADQATAMNEMLAAFIDAIGQAAGVDRAAVVAALNEMTDEVAGRVREHLDADGMPQEPKMESKMEKQPEAKKDDEQRADEIEAKAKQNDLTIALSRIDALEAKAATGEAKIATIEATAKADKDAREKARIDAMVAGGAILDGERDDATFMLSAYPERFERIYGSRKGLSKKVPIGVSQAGDEAPLDPEKATPSDLRESEVGTFNFLCRQGGWSQERALKAVIARRNKSTGAASAAKVG